MGASCGKDACVVNTENMPLLQLDASDGSTRTSEFHPFHQLNDDVLLCILSFVSFAPFEQDVSGTMTLSELNNPSAAQRHKETLRLLQDYNAGATKLNKSLFKRKISISPFRAPHQYLQEAFDVSETSFGDNVESLSLVASTRMFGTLTHVLPLVNKRVHKLCKQSDVLWTESLERLLGFRNSQARSDIGSGELWEASLKSFLDCSDTTDNEEISEDCSNKTNDGPPSSENERVRRLITKACDCVRNERGHEHGTSSVAKEVIQRVLLDHKPARLPLFSMLFTINIGEEFDLRLFEPRYRLMITEVMAGRVDRESKGFPLSTPRPRFLLAYSSDIWRRPVTCIVEVRRCLVRSAGIVDISVFPVSFAILEKLTLRPDSGGLMDGTLVRSPMRMQSPAFCMRTPLRLREPMRLRLHEQRYKTLISEVMAGRSDEERHGSPVSAPRPQFVFVFNNRFNVGSVACLVDIERCRIHNDGTAQVTVVPTVRVLVESFSRRPKSGNLYDASVLYPVNPLLGD